MDPLFDPILIVFPQDNVRELNRRLRHYYKYQPFIRSIIDLHTETPISDFDLACEGNKEAEEYFNDFKDRVNLLDHLVNLCRDYWLLGEGFLYGNWDDHNNEFGSFVQLPPEEVEVHSAYIMPERVHVLRPNKDLAKMSMSRNPADVQLNKLMTESSPLYAQALKENKPFILDSNRLVVMQRSMAGYSNRGVSPVMGALKDLLFEDYLNLFRMVFIQRHSYPLKIFKIGSVERGFIPPPRFYNEFRRLLATAKNDPDFNIVTHPFVTTEMVTGHDKILPLVPMYDLVKSRIFAALFASDALISGEKTPYASGITYMRGLMHKYFTFRNNLENELNRKIFLNLSRMRNFRHVSKAEADHKIVTKHEDRLIVPRIYWKKANLLSNQAIQQMILTLREKKEIPMKFVSEVFGWDYDDLLRQLKAEEGTRSDSVWQELRRKVLTDKKMDLGTLGRKVLLGETIDEALKAELKDELKTPSQKDADEEATKGKKSDFKLPEVAGEKPGGAPEFAARPPELGPPRPPIGGPGSEGVGSAPRPSEEGAGASPAAGAGETT